MQRIKYSRKKEGKKEEAELLNLRNALNF